MAVWRLQILFKKHDTHLNSIGDSISNQVSCEFSLVLHSHELVFSPEKVLPSLCDAYFFRGISCAAKVYEVLQISLSGADGM